MTPSLLGMLPLLLPGAGSGPTPVQFADDTFADADWDTSSIVVGSGSADGTGLQVLTGNPAPARQVTHSFVAGGGFISIYMQHFSTASVYDPALQGPIAQITFELDYRTVAVTQSFRPALLQGTRIYVASGAGATAFSTNWTTLGPKSLTAAVFAERLPDGSTDGLSQPDFSVSGAPITFGFETSTITNGSFVYAAEYDNFAVDVNCVVATSLARLGSPPNPNAFVPGATGGPVVGETWDPFIDHTSFLPGATIDFAGYSLAPANIPSVFGTILCDEILVCVSVAAGQPFAFAIPDDLTLVGAAVCFGGASYDPLAGLQLTNALDVTIGCH